MAGYSSQPLRSIAGRDRLRWGPTATDTPSIFFGSRMDLDPAPGGQCSDVEERISRDRNLRLRRGP